MRALIAEDPKAPPLEVLRRLREEGHRLGESTFYRLHRAERASPAFHGMATNYGKVPLYSKDVVSAFRINVGHRYVRRIVGWEQSREWAPHLSSEFPVAPESTGVVNNGARDQLMARDLLE